MKYGVDYEFTRETIGVNGHTLHRIVALRPIEYYLHKTVRDGETGGWIERPENMADYTWVADEGCVFGNARLTEYAIVEGNACVYDNACVSGYARIRDNATVNKEATVSGGALVFGEASISWNAIISEKAQVHDKAGVSGNALVRGHADISGSAYITDDACVEEDAHVTEKARVFGNAHIFGKVTICGHTNLGPGAVINHGSQALSVSTYAGDDSVTFYKTEAGIWVTNWVFAKPIEEYRRYMKETLCDEMLLAADMAEMKLNM